jgi:hypothetical protein
MCYYWKDEQMNKKALLSAILVAVFGWSLGDMPKLQGAEPVQTLVRFDENFDVGSVITSDAKVIRSEAGRLRIETGHEKPWPGITLKAPEGKWDLSKYEYVSLNVKNTGYGQLPRGQSRRGRHEKLRGG